MRKQTKLVAVLSAAALLAIGASMTSFAATGWSEENGTWVYLDRNGDRVYDQWKKSGNQYFFLDENGEMATERIISVNEDKFYVDANGARVSNQWVSVENAEDVEVGGNAVSTIWYYLGNNGKAYKAASGNTSVVKEITSNKYVFDEDGQMLSGWQEVGDKKDLYYLGDENQGWALTKWQLLETGGTVFNDEYQEAKWFYFNGGKADRAKEGEGTVTKYRDGAYYTFDEKGVMQTNWYKTTTPASASGSESLANASGAIGSGWVYSTPPGNEDGSQSWYYLVNVKDDKGKIVARGVPFNYQGKEEYQAKYIKNKTYLFDNNGVMKTGVIELKKNVDKVEDGSKELKAGIYYFNKADGSVKGQLVTGKATIETDGEKDYYYFSKTGQAYQNRLIDGSIYQEDGKRLDAEDGSTYQVYDVTDISKDGTADNKVIGPVIVSASGRVKQSGSVKIDGNTWVVKDYTATLKPGN